MNTPYPFSSILLNEREVAISRILSGEFRGDTHFEKATATFIMQWLCGTDDFILHTSGSTGPAKRISVRRSQMEASAKATLTALGVQKDDVAWVVLDTRYIAGIMMLVRSLVGGLRIIAQEPSSDPLAKFQIGFGISFTAFVPLQLSNALQRHKSSLDEIRCILVGGAAVDATLLPRIKSLKCKIFATYGMTETISHIALKQLSGGTQDEFYRALPGVRTSIDERGCIVISTNYLDQPLLTNDIVELCGNGMFRWVGRIDNVINTGGVKVSPEETEDLINTIKHGLNLHGRMVISSRPDPVLGDRIVLVTDSKPLEKEAVHRVLKELSDQLPRYHAPKEIIFLPSLPETEGGKTDRRAIRSILASK